MKAGIVEVKITPDFPALMDGFPEPIDRFARGVHDDLWAHCFYINNDGEELAIVTMDLLFYTKPRVKVLRAKIEARTGIPAENCLISCTHTHSGPVTRTNPLNRTADERELMYPDYIEEIDKRVVNALHEAKTNAFPAEIGVGKGQCGKEQGVGGNRRDRDGIADPAVWVLGIRDLDGNPRGAIVRYSLHPTVLGQDNDLITCDFPHYLYEQVKDKYPKMGVGFQNGTSGDQSTRHFRTGTTFEECERIGRTIGTEVVRVIETMEYNANPTIRLTKTDVFPERKPIPSYEDALAAAEKARADLAEARETGKPVPFVRTLECTLIGAEAMLGFAKSGQEVTYAMNANHPFEIDLLAIDDARILMITTEMFAEYSLRLYEASPFAKTYLCTCVGGLSLGYVCPQSAHDEGGYEALVSIYTGKTGEIIMDAMTDLLEKSKNA